MTVRVRQLIKAAREIIPPVPPEPPVPPRIDWKIVSSATGVSVNLRTINLPPMDTVGANLIVTCTNQYQNLNPTASTVYDDYGNVYVPKTLWQPAGIPASPQLRFFISYPTVTNPNHVIRFTGAPTASVYPAMAAAAFQARDNVVQALEGPPWGNTDPAAQFLRTASPAIVTFPAALAISSFANNIPTAVPIAPDGFIGVIQPAISGTAVAVGLAFQILDFDGTPITVWPEWNGVEPDRVATALMIFQSVE